MTASDATVVEGVVSRISGSGNAILETSGGEEFNLGPVRSEIVGEQVRALKLSEIWALCLDPAYVTEEYLNEMRPRAPRSVDLDSINVNQQRSVATGSATADDIGRIESIEICSSSKTYRFDDDKPIRVQQPNFLKNFNKSVTVPVEIVAVRSGIAIGVLALEELDPDVIEAGSEIEMIVQYAPKDRDAVVGFTKDSELPVHSTDLLAPSGAVSRVGILNVFNTHLDASPTALPEEIWPEEGETVYVTLHQVTDSGKGYGFTDGLPVVLPDSLSCLSSADRFKTQVVGQSDSVLTIAVDKLDSAERPERNDVIRATVIHRQKDGTLCRSRDVPVWIPSSIPGVIDTIKCRVIEINTSHLVGSVAECPKVQSLSRSDEIQIRVDYSAGDDGVGMYEGIPVVIPGGHGLVNEEITLGFSEANAGVIIAGVDARNETPIVGDEIVVSEEEFSSRRGDLCFVNSYPIILPTGSSWPSGDIRLGVEAITPSGIRVGVSSLPEDSRPNVSDEIYVPMDNLNAESATTLVDGLPITLPPELSSWDGPLRLGVESVEPNCLQCSIRGLEERSIPELGEVVKMDVGSNFRGGIRGRVLGVPTFLPRTSNKHCRSTEVIIVGLEEEYLNGVDVSDYNLKIDTETLAFFYRYLLEVRKAWEKDDYKQAIEYCRIARNSLQGNSLEEIIFRLETIRHGTLLMGEDVRMHRGVKAAEQKVEDAIETLDPPEIPAATYLERELDAYRFALTGINKNGWMTSTCITTTSRNINKLRSSEENPWSDITPHPIFTTFLASVLNPRYPGADEVDHLISQTPEHWPFLTVSEVSKVV